MTRLITIEEEKDVGRVSTNKRELNVGHIGVSERDNIVYACFVRLDEIDLPLENNDTVFLQYRLLCLIQSKQMTTLLEGGVLVFGDAGFSSGVIREKASSGESDRPPIEIGERNDKVVLFEHSVSLTHCPVHIIDNEFKRGEAFFSERINKEMEVFLLGEETEAEMLLRSLGETLVEVVAAGLGAWETFKKVGEDGEEVIHWRWFGRGLVERVSSLDAPYPEVR